jgi:hypothetical protein
LTMKINLSLNKEYNGIHARRRSMKSLTASYWEVMKKLETAYGHMENVKTFGFCVLEADEIEKVGINSKDFYGLAWYLEDAGVRV